jgi:hypothetical protein
LKQLQNLFVFGQNLFQLGQALGIDIGADLQALSSKEPASSGKWVLAFPDD